MTLSGRTMKSEEFDRAYRYPITLWGDVRIPPEVEALAKEGSPKTSLELGCGIGRFSRYLAQQGIRATAVDFSQVAIAKAKSRAARDAVKPTYLVGDVTNLEGVEGPFDFSFDVGCFHCLQPEGQRKYASEISRLLAPGGTHLIWAIDRQPSGHRLTDAVVKETFGSEFQLRDVRRTWRRLIPSHWYWLVRAPR